MLKGPRECSVCGRALVYSRKLDAWRCLDCQRQRTPDESESENPNITFFEGVEVDST